MVIMCAIYFATRKGSRISPALQNITQSGISSSTPDLQTETPQSPDARKVLYDQCEAVSTSTEICVTTIGSANDYWGSRMVTDYYVSDLQGQNRERFLSKSGYAMDIFGYSNGNLFLRIDSYEGSGPGYVLSVNVFTHASTTLDINAYGYVSPDKKYYVTYGDTDNASGSVFCNSPGENGSRLPASAIKLLSFDTGRISTLVSDRHAIFQIDHWATSSDAVFYSMYELPVGQMDMCPLGPEAIHDNVLLSR